MESPDDEPTVTVDEDRLRAALARFLRLAVARDRTRAVDVRRDEDWGASDEPLLAAFVTLVEAHERARAAWRLPLARHGGTDVAASALAGSIADLLHEHAMGAALLARLEAVLRDADFELSAAALAAIAEDLEPLAVASVGGPLEAAARAAARVRAVDDQAAEPPTVDGVQPSDAEIVAYVAALLGPGRLPGP